jgi:Dolichyl-phosphate-mannose-protein mannosyltransferase
VASAIASEDAPVRPPARALHGIPLLLLLVAAVLARLPALLNARGVHSDAAIVGLQAMHILEGEWSWFLWGAGYQASFDALLLAAAFAVTGPSALTLMVVPLIGHLLLVALAYDVLRRAVGRGCAAVACLPLVFSPQSVNGVALYAPRQWSITAVALAVWLAATAVGRPRAPLWLAGSGAAAGFAVYLDLFTLQMIPAVAVLALWCALADRRGAPLRTLALLGGTVVGAAVVAWSRAQPVADATKAGFTLERLAANAELLVGTCLPYLFGLRVFAPGADIMWLEWVPPWPVRVVQWVGAVAFTAAVVWAAVVVVRRTGPVAVRRLGALGLLGSAASIGGFLVSTMPADLLSARYLAPIIWLAPFTLAPAAYALGTRWSAVGIAPFVLAVGLGGWLAFGPYVAGPLPVNDPRGVARDEDALAAELRSQGVRYAAAQYWLSYRLTFLWQEDPVVVPLDPREDRYLPYREAFEAAPVVAYVFHPSEPRAQPGPVEEELQSAGLSPRRLELNGFTVLIVER